MLLLSQADIRRLSKTSKDPTSKWLLSVENHVQSLTVGSAHGYLGYTTLQDYDVNTCADKCNAINGCMAINIYYERDPSVEPGAGCSNPTSVAMIKCVFWGGSVSSDNAVNRGD
jgi:hypothetical protein